MAVISDSDMMRLHAVFGCCLAEGLISFSVDTDISSKGYRYQKTAYRSVERRGEGMRADGKKGEDRDGGLHG